jgi:hypothetical protein
MLLRAGLRHSPGGVLLRLSLYAAACAGTFETLVLACAAGWGEAATAENGPVEVMHMLLAAASAFFFTLAARRSRPRYALFSLFAIGAATLAVRELDRVIDRYLGPLGQDLIFSFAAIAAALVVWCGRSGLWAEASRFFESRASGLLFAAMTAILLFSQLIGQRELWSGLMGDRYMWQVKRTAEESAELLGQILLFIAAIESFIWAGCSWQGETVTVDAASANALDSGASPRRRPAASEGSPESQ